MGFNSGFKGLTGEPFVESALTVGIKLCNIQRLAAGIVNGLSQILDFRGTLCGPGSVDGTATGYRLDGTRI